MAIPTNAKAFLKFLVNSNEDIDVASFGSEQQDVLRYAVDKARKAGRSYIKYEDYPPMKSGEKVSDFYRQKRADRSLLSLISESFSDPAFEVFTTIGVFNFKDTEDGGFEVVPDKYDFDKSKSKGNRKEKDTYSKLTFAAQDMSEGREDSFFIKGRIAGKDVVDVASAEAFSDISSDAYVESIYNSVEDNFLADGKISEENVPLEFLALVRESAANSGIPDDGFLLASEILPKITDETPDIINELAVIKNEEGLMKIVDRALFEDQQMMQPMDIDANIAPVDQQYGRIIDAPRNLDVERPSMPVAILSDDQLADMQSKIKHLASSEETNFTVPKPRPDFTPKPEGDLTFSQAFASARKEGLDEFTWRGNRYHTKTKEEVNG